MSLLITSNGREGYVELACSICCSLMGQVTLKEAGELSNAGIRPLCFDCDPETANLVPNQLYCSDDHYLLGIGQTVFLAEWVNDGFLWEQKDLRLQKISHLTFFDLKTGWGPAYTPLSSSLNLNRISNVAAKSQQRKDKSHG